MNGMKFAVCDDDPLMAQELSRRLEEYLEESGASGYQVFRFSSGRALLEKAGSFDVTFLDIQMAQPNGMETARLLREQGDRSLLIFVTVLREWVFDAFQVEAYDYLLKPLDDSRFRRTMDRVRRALEQKVEKRLVVRQGAACEVIPLSELLYCEVLGRKLYLHKSGGEVTEYYGRLAELEHQVDGRFFKCHRSYLVNLDYVRGCRDGQVLLFGGEAIPLSRLRERELAQALLRTMRKGVL